MLVVHFLVLSSSQLRDVSRIWRPWVGFKAEPENSYMIYRRDGKIIGRNIISSHIFWALCPSAPAGKRPASTLPQDLALKGEIWFFSM